MTTDDLTHADARWQRLADAELCDEPLTPDELEFLADHRASDPVVRVEQQLRRALGEHGRDDVVDPAADDRMISAAVDRFLGRDVAPPPVRLRPWLGVGVGVLLAAGLALVWTLRSPAPPALDPLTLLSGAPQVEGAAPVLGDSLARASELHTADEPACVGNPGRVRACLGPHSHARLADDGALELLAGDVAVEISAPADLPVAYFALQVAGVRMTSEDGDFAVSVRSRTWTAAASRGAVELRDAAGPLARLGAGDRLSRGQPLLPVPGDSPEIPAAIEPAPALEPAAPVDPPALEDSPAPTEPAAPPVPKDSPSARPVPPAPEMLEQVRELRRAGRVREAVVVYKQLISGYPDSPYAGTARLALGQLYLGAVNDPAAALRAFDAYLERGGPLAEEAAHGRISALRRLHRDRDARLATERFLADYPASSYADELRRQAQP